MAKNNDLDINNIKHIERVYSDKAYNLLKYCIPIFMISGFTYILGLYLYNSFDFGLIFEIISFIFILLALKKINKHDLQSAKKNIIIAMIPLGWLIIYDFFNLSVNILEVIKEVIVYFTTTDSLFYNLSPYLCDVTVIISIILLYKSYSNLNKADETSKSDNYTDTFYDKL